MSFDLWKCAVFDYGWRQPTIGPDGWYFFDEGVGDACVVDTIWAQNTESAGSTFQSEESCEFASTTSVIHYEGRTSVYAASLGKDYPTGSGNCYTPEQPSARVRNESAWEVDVDSPQHFEILVEQGPGPDTNSWGCDIQIRTESGYEITSTANGEFTHLYGEVVPTPAYEFQFWCFASRATELTPYNVPCGYHSFTYPADNLLLNGFGVDLRLSPIAADSDVLTLRFLDQQTIDWTALGSESAWAVYRGGLVGLRESGSYTQDPALSPDAARFCQVMNSTFNDTYQPEARTGVFYLVTRQVGGEQSGLGFDSSGTERPNTFPCP